MAVTNGPATEDAAPLAGSGFAAESVAADEAPAVDADAVSTANEQDLTAMTGAALAGAEDLASASAAPSIEGGDMPWCLAPEGDGAPSLDDAAQSPAQLQQAQSEIDRLQELLLRVYAENENLRKRTARDVGQARKFALERIVSELLAVKDSMDLGLAACQEEGVDLPRIREGMELTLKMLHQVFDKFGVQILDPVAQGFDPQFHEAMTVQEIAGTEAGTVLQVVQKGCLLNGRLVRPAKVIVAK